MSTVEIVVFLVLWIALVFLSALVVLLYRQLERAYLGSSVQAQLAIGSLFPALEIATADGLQPYTFPQTVETAYALIVSTSCSSCFEALKLLPELVDHEQIIVFTAGEWKPDVFRVTEGLISHVLGHPPDAERALGLSVYPAIIATRQGRIVASTGEHTRAKLAKFVSDAEKVNLAELVTDHIAMAT